MTRKKVKLTFIENITKRKASYNKKLKGLLNKAHELNILCDVELTTVLCSPFHKEPMVFRNLKAATNTFTTFKELPKVVQLKNMKIQEKFTKQRVKKIEEQLRKVRKENKIMELTNQMYELLNGVDIPTSMHLYDLNDLSYVIYQHLNQVHDMIKIKTYEEGSTSDASQPITESIEPGGTSFDRSMTPLMASVGVPESPSFSHLLSLNDDDTKTLLDDTSFIVNVQDPNHHNK